MPTYEGAPSHEVDTHAHAAATVGVTSPTTATNMDGTQFSMPPEMVPLQESFNSVGTAADQVITRAGNNQLDTDLATGTYADATPISTPNRWESASAMTYYTNTSFRHLQDAQQAAGTTTVDGSLHSYPNGTLASADHIKKPGDGFTGGPPNTRPPCTTIPGCQYCDGGSSGMPAAGAVCQQCLYNGVAKFVADGNGVCGAC
jgi:hypothetical protein